MALSVTQEQKQLQTQVLNQSLIESLHLLTMPSAELEPYLEEECEKNPLLKIVKKDSVKDVNSSYISQNALKKSDNYQAIINQVPTEDKSLYETLTSQIGLLKLSESESEIANIIVSALDEKGLLIKSSDELLKNINTPNKTDIFENVRNIIKHLEPVGSASYTVWEAMKTELEELKNTHIINSKEYEKCLSLINEDGFNVIASGKENAISNYLNISKDEASDVLSIIKSLHPYPSTGYSSNPSNYIYPELSIKKDKEGNLTVSIISDFIPDITIDDEYIKMLDSTKESATRKYLEQNKKKAETLINALHERDNTLLLIGKTLATKQYEFFIKGPSFISPLTLKDVSEEIHRDESTISRIASSKYIETDFGTFPIKTFFSRSGGTTTDGVAISRDKIKLILKNIIDMGTKDGKKLSDEKLRAELEKRDIKLSRRTVAKYRSELGIEASQ